MGVVLVFQSQPPRRLIQRQIIQIRNLRLLILFKLIPAQNQGVASVVVIAVLGLQLTVITYIIIIRLGSVRRLIILLTNCIEHNILAAMRADQAAIDQGSHLLSGTPTTGDQRIVIILHPCFTANPFRPFRTFTSAKLHLETVHASC